METKIVLVLMLMLALTAGFCDAHEGDNIFDVKYETRYRRKELDDQFTKPAVEPDVQKVATFIAGADERWSLLGRFPIEELRKLAEIELSRPIETCNADLFRKQSDLCKQLSGPKGNVYLSEYCNYCVDKRMETCSNDLFNKVVGRSLLNYKLLEYSMEISKYMNRHGNERAPKEYSVKMFMETSWLRPDDRDKLIYLCDQLKHTLQDNTAHLDTDGKKLAAFLEDNETTKRVVMYKRCLIVNDLYKDVLVRVFSSFKLLDYSNEISNYIKRHGDIRAPQDYSVERFMETSWLSPEKRRDFILQCRNLVESIKDYTAHQDKDSKKLDAYLKDNAKTEQVLMYERCLIMNRLFKDQ